MPDFAPLQYLWDAWGEAGGIGADMTPLPWPEVRAYAVMAGLDAQEARVLRAMSVGYLTGRRTGMKPLGRAPYEP